MRIRFVFVRSVRWLWSHKITIFGGCAILITAVIGLRKLLRYLPNKTPAQPATLAVAVPQKRSVIEVSLPDVFVGESCKRSVAIANRGSGTARLREIQLSCACLSAQFEPKILRPGQIGNLTIALRSPEKVGPVTNHVSLFFDDDSKDGWTVLVLARGRALSWAEIDPKVLDFGKLRPNKRVARRVRIHSTVSREISMRALSANLEVQQQRVIGTGPGIDVEYTVGLRPELMARIQKYRGELELNSKDEDYWPIRIPVFYKVVSPVCVEPNRIVLADVRANASVVRRIRITPTGAGPLPEPAVKHHLGDCLKCETERPGPSCDGIVLRLDFHPNASRAFLSDEIQVDFGLFAVSIPFVARVLKDAYSGRTHDVAEKKKR